MTGKTTVIDLSTADDLRRAELGEVMAALVIECKLGSFTTAARRTRVRKLGERLNEGGGLPLMQIAAYLVRTLWRHGLLGKGDASDFHPAEIDHAWNGVGQWLA